MGGAAISSAAVRRASASRFHAHVGAGGVLERLERARAGDAGLQLAAAELGDPFAPLGPPRAGTLLGLGEPLLRRARRLAARPVAVLLGSRRIDHARDVARGREAEPDRSLEKPGRGV